MRSTAIERSGVSGTPAPPIGPSAGARASSGELLLFTDQRCPPDHPLAKFIDPNDPRGWWGDGIDVRTDLGEAPLGSLLWTLRRSTITSNTALWAQSLALDALAPMIGQQSIVEATATATAYPVESRLALKIGLYARDVLDPRLHLRAVEAIRAHDPQAASAAMREHAATALSAKGVAR